jgi:hypothetical protein
MEDRYWHIWGDQVGGQLAQFEFGETDWDELGELLQVGDLHAAMGGTERDGSPQGRAVGDALPTVAHSTGRDHLQGRKVGENLLEHSVGQLVDGLKKNSVKT